MSQSGRPSWLTAGGPEEETEDTLYMLHPTRVQVWGGVRVGRDLLGTV